MIRPTRSHAAQPEVEVVQVVDSYTKRVCWIYLPSLSAVVGEVEPGIDQRTATVAMGVDDIAGFVVVG